MVIGSYIISFVPIFIYDSIKGKRIFDSLISGELDKVPLNKMMQIINQIGSLKSEQPRTCDYLKS